MRRTVLLKVKGENLDAIVRHGKYAMNLRLRLTAGDLILLSQNRGSLERGQPPIRYGMTFIRFYEDTDGESARIWGKQWTYILEGKGCRPLRNPFDLRLLQVTKRNYGQAGPVYLDDDDVRVLEAGHYLETK